MLAKISSSALFGVDAYPVSVEVSVTRGLGYMITGLPDDGIKESLSRIAIAIHSNDFQMPRTKLVINLAPADTRKTGSAFDLPIALGILLATEQIASPGKPDEYLVIGELGLDGSLFPVRGALCMAYQAKRDGYKGIILPKQNANEAALVGGLLVFGARHLKEVARFIESETGFEMTGAKPPKLNSLRAGPDFSDVRGQSNVKRALEIAAAGGHNALIIGPPGIGKTMLAKRLPSILPPMSLEEALETTRIYSVMNQGDSLTGLVTERPFRSPHQTTSDVALVGGGSIPMPGEISLAHNGVLFLDELAEFRRNVIEVLRQPLEERKVLISRARCSLIYPSSFMLLAAMNPCLCGYLGHPTRTCTCSGRAIYWYRRRVSSPLLERIDLQIEAEPQPLREVIEWKEMPETSAKIRDRVIRAREIQTARFRNEMPVYSNSQMPDQKLGKYCFLDPAVSRFLVTKMDALQLSVRSYTRILKVSRTIADLAGREQIALEHIAEAISYRCLDKPLTIPKSAKTSGFQKLLKVSSNGKTY